MPMDFPDMRSLINAAEVHEFRKLNDGETEIQYRQALADHVQQRDFIESEEIRNGYGWDKWNDGQIQASLGRKGFIINKGETGTGTTEFETKHLRPKPTKTN